MKTNIKGRFYRAGATCSQTRQLPRTQGKGRAKIDKKEVNKDIYNVEKLKQLLNFSVTNLYEALDGVCMRNKEDKTQTANHQEKGNSNCQGNGIPHRTPLKEQGT